jgi:hypothetical protein
MALDGHSFSPSGILTVCMRPPGGTRPTTLKFSKRSESTEEWRRLGCQPLCRRELPRAITALYGRRGAVENESRLGEPH